MKDMKDFKESNLNWEKILNDMRGGYKEEHDIDIMFTELIANSIDAGASKLKIIIDYENNSVTFVDDGKGMNRDDFEEYHNLGSISTKRKGSGIGFAGIGCKLYIDKCEKVITVTKQKANNYYLKSEWLFDKDKRKPIYSWSESNADSENIGKFGTFIKVVNPEELGKVPIGHIRDKILEHYNFALGNYGTLSITLNEEPLEPVLLDGAIENIDTGSKIKNSDIKIKGQLSYSKNSHIQGIAIVVFGKTVYIENNLFHNLNLLKNFQDAFNISGYLRCDGLIYSVVTEKNDLNRKTQPWKRFESVVVDLVRKLLQKWKLTKEDNKDQSEDREMTDFVKDVVNKLFSRPEIMALDINPFMTIPKDKTRTPIKSSDGNQQGTVSPGSELVNGVEGGNGNDQTGTLTKGPFDGEGFTLDPAGKDKGKTVERRRRSGINVVYIDGEGKLRGILGEEEIKIDKNHPAFKAKSKLESDEVEVFYLLDVICEVLCSTKEAEEEISECKLVFFNSLTDLL